MTINGTTPPLFALVIIKLESKVNFLYSYSGCLIIIAGVEVWFAKSSISLFNE